MAQRIQPISLTTLCGLVVAFVLTVLSLGTVAAVAWRAEGLSRLGAEDWAAVRFTLWQAAVSAVLSAVCAIPVARALARRRFWGRAALLTILGAPFILPVIVAVLGLVAVYGRNGLLSQVSVAFGGAPLQIYGAHGVILAHVFFNLPLATRLILQGWMSIPAERVRLANSLGFSSYDMFWHLERPMLKETLPGILLVIFLICTTSFAIALTLGGGPKATTIELAIYQAFRFDFDLAKAALLGVVQFILCAVLALTSFVIAVPNAQGAGLDRILQRHDGNPVIDAFAIALVSLFLITPLVMILLRALPGLSDLSPDMIWAAWRSLWVATISAGLSVSMALSLGLLVQKLSIGKPASSISARAVELTGYLSMSASALVMGSGLFIMIYTWIDPTALALPVTIVVNAAMSLPFVLRSIMPELQRVQKDWGRLSQSLGLSGWTRLRIVTLPRLRRPLCFGAGLSAALSMGDLGVITLFATPENATLPLTLYNLMAAYRMDEAYAAALILLALSLLVFWLFDQRGRRDVDH